MWHFFEYDEISSTNDQAKALTANEKEKFVVIAKNQTAGRGRRGRNWKSFEGNLFFSIALPNQEQQNTALVLISSLAILETIKKLDNHIKVELKWPNDVLLNDKKISGILLEKGQREYMIIGIGVNIKISPVSEDLIYPVTSLAEEGIKISPQSFMTTYIYFFDKLINTFEREGMIFIVREWMKYAKGVGSNIIVRLPKTDKEGKFAGLADDDGSLILQTSSGKEKITVGDVFFDN